MKKLVSICFACVLLTFAAGAANVGTIDNGYPGDTEAQAQMLCDLGLFRGTENGFELEKPMTRAEAAAMTVRFFGAEQETLAGDWSHPFTDVPQWADKYVGWLYQNELTRGTSASTYGAEENVTCEQYNTFLARALSTSGSWMSPAEQAEIDACDAVGFVRGDAVSLSTRALGLSNLRYHTMHWGDIPVVDQPGSVTEAWALVQEGVFTAEQLKQAAWDVLPRRYSFVDQYGNVSQDNVFSCLIAGVPVIRNAEADFHLVNWDENGAVYHAVYGYTSEQQPDGTYRNTLYQADPNTLEISIAGTIEDGGYIHSVAAIGDIDYLCCSVGKEERLAAVEDGTLKIYPQPSRKDTLYQSFVYSSDGAMIACNMVDGVYVVDELHGVRLLPGKDEDVQFVGDSIVVTQRVGDVQTVLTARTPDGEAITQWTVSNPTGDAASLFAPRLSGRTGSYVWGTAGLYRAADGRLTQLSARPVVDCLQDAADGSLVFLSYGPDEQPYVLDGWEDRLAGTEVHRLSPDGTEQQLLANMPQHGLNFCMLTFVDHGVVRAAAGRELSSSGAVYDEYAVEHGKLRAVLQKYSSVRYGFHTQAECSQEQARLDALGVGA